MVIKQVFQAVGRNIRHFRKLRRMSQSVLGHLIQLSRQAIHRYETGRVPLPATRIPILCIALGITREQLFAGLPP